MRAMPIVASVGAQAALILAFATLVSGTAASAQAPSGTALTLIGSNTISMPGQLGGQGVLRFQFDTTPPGTPPHVIDYGDGLPGTATPGDVTRLDAEADGSWQVPIVIAKLGRNVTQTHYLRVSSGGHSQTGTYTISNKYPDTFSWTVISLAGTQSWSDKAFITAVVSVGPVPATHLVASAPLLDDTTATTFGGGILDVCWKADGGDCIAARTLGANQTFKVYLRLPKGVQPSPGRYAGPIQLIASEDKTPATQATIYVTDSWHKLYGVLAIAAGVAFSFLVTLLIRNQLARLQLLAPAVALHQSFAGLGLRAAGLSCQGNTAQTTLARIRDWKTRLSIAELVAKGYIPGCFAVAAPAAPSAAYQQLLDKAGPWAAALAQIVDTGLVPVSASDTAGAGNAAPAAILMAWNDIDALAVSPVDPAIADAQLPAAPALDGLVTSIKTTLDALHAAMTVGAARAAAAPYRTETQQLQYQIAILNLASWIVVATLTITVGSYMLVFSHMDFGRVNDLWLCFLWGLGLPVAGSQLTQASTPTSLAAGMGVSIVKPAG